MTMSCSRSPVAQAAAKKRLNRTATTNAFDPPTAAASAAAANAANAATATAVVLPTINHQWRPTDVRLKPH